MFCLSMVFESLMMKKVLNLSYTCFKNYLMNCRKSVERIIIYIVLQG